MKEYTIWSMKWTRALSFCLCYDGFSAFWNCVCFAISWEVVLPKSLWLVNFVHTAYTFKITFDSSTVKNLRLRNKCCNKILKFLLEIVYFVWLHTIISNAPKNQTLVVWKIKINRTFYLINRSFIFSETSKGIKSRKWRAEETIEKDELDWTIRINLFKDKNIV